MVMITAVAVVATGCGSAGGGGESGDAAAVVSDYLTALADGDGTKACAQMTAEARAVMVTAGRTVSAVRADDCSGVFDRLSSLLPTPALGKLRTAAGEVDAKDAKIEGQAATVTVPGATVPIQLTDENGDWKITGETLRRSLGLAR